MSTPQRWWKSPWPWGITVTLVLAFATGQSAHNTNVGIGVLTGLVGFVLTTCVSIYLQSEKQHRDLQEILLGVSKSPTLLHTVRTLAPSWNEIDKRQHIHLMQIRDALAKEFIDYVERIATDRVVTMRGRPYEWKRANLADLQNFWVIHVNDLGYWHTPAAEHYLKQQERAIFSGLALRRVFVCDVQPESSIMRRTIERQISIGVEVRVLILRKLPVQDRKNLQKYCVNRGVAKDSSGAWLLTSRDGRDANTIDNLDIEWELLSYRKSEVDAAMNGFKTLWERAQDGQEFLSRMTSPPVP